MSKQVFLSYGRSDIAHARRLVSALRSKGLMVWFDEDSLLPGHRWKDEIKKAISKSDFFIALLSTSSVNKRGYVQAEMSHALDVFDQIPHGQIYLIPVRVDECEVTHPQLQDLHWVDLFPDWQMAVNKVVQAMGITIHTVENHHLPAKATAHSALTLDLSLDTAAISAELQTLREELNQIVRDAEIDVNIRSVSLQFQRWRKRATNFIRDNIDEVNALRFSLIAAPDFIRGKQPRLLNEAIQCCRYLDNITTATPREGSS